MICQEMSMKRRDDKEEASSEPQELTAWQINPIWRDVIDFKVDRDLETFIAAILTVGCLIDEVGM